MSEPLSTDPLIGRTVSQYEILAKLGGGAMGVVYKARDVKLGRLVALKFLPPQWSHDEIAKQRFVREAQAASATHHRNICVIHNIDQTDDDRLFIVMAYYEGETLKQRLERGRLSIEETIEIGSEIAEGLARAHAQGVVHRDIKPGNLMLTDDGVKILDFGLAKFADALQLTIPGSSIGTGSYMSPEQARGEEADARSDVWALGIVMFEMLTGRVPFSGAYVEATFHAIKHEALPSLRSARPDIPEALERLVMRALEKDPAERFENARVPARNLRFMAGRSMPLELRTEPVPRPSATPPEGTTPRRWIQWAAFGLVIAGLAVAMTVWWMWRPIERTTVAVVPIANLTGLPEIDGYVQALTYSLIGEIEGAPGIRVIPYLRLLEIARPFNAVNGQSASTAAIQAIAEESGAPLLVVPTLIYRDRDATWSIQTQIRNAQTGTAVASYETPAVTSSLSEQTAFRLVETAASDVRQHFGGGRASAASGLGRFHSPAAARAFVRGVDAYDRLEFTAALEAFTESASLDSQRAETYAWLGRVLLLLARKNEAIGAAQRARSLLPAGATGVVPAFVAAVAAECEGDGAAAERAYLALVSLDDESAFGHLELADYLKRRQDANQRSVDAYHRALAIDSTYIRPHVELCQLYTRLDDHPKAESEATLAIKRYRERKLPLGEAQALLCLGEAQREQGGAHLADAAANIAAARALIDPSEQPYGASRAIFYQGSVSYSAGELQKAGGFYEQAAMELGRVGNRVLEGVALMNLGAVNGVLGHPSKANAFYARSREAFLAVGDERRVAEADNNRASTEIEHGLDLAGASRALANARSNFERMGHVDFQLAAMESEATAYRYLGALERARTLLGSAVGLARTRELSSREASLTIALAETDIQAGNYASALAAIEPMVTGAAGRGQLQARITYGIVLTRLGRFDDAAMALDSVSADITAQERLTLLPLAHLAQAQLAIEQGDLGRASVEYDLAVSSWSDPLPNAASAEARCGRGWLTAQTGDTRRALRDLGEALAAAERSGRLSVNTECRLDFARASFLGGQAAEGLQTLASIEGDTPERTLGPELRARVEYWRSEGLRVQGSPNAAEHLRSARATLASLVEALPAAARPAVMMRRELRAILGDGAVPRP